MSPIPTISLGGSASHIKVGRVAFGCMGMSWAEPSQQTPDKQAFEAIKAAVDAGSNFLNSMSSNYRPSFAHPSTSSDTFSRSELFHI